ncbi:MAG TPA: DUF87 domain-containing protein [Candidatus Limnocylindrales bacterium]|nr:DUF87 domain-containing protein [Candidatus Limnocylindrales bacterium]
MNDPVGLVGSPSTTAKATVDILENATGSPLHGSLVYLTHPMLDKTLIAIGTVTEIETANRWHEDPNMRGVLKKHGSLPHLSAVGDVRTAEVLVQAAYLAEAPDPSIGEPPVEAGGALTMSPTTGAAVAPVSDEFLTQLLRRHVGEITYLGRIYKSNVRLPLTLRHFGPADEGGAGEAYHSGIFGMTGSGKSALATYVIAAQLTHPQLSILVMDPQGQFTSEEGLPFSLQEWAESRGRVVRTYGIANDLRLRQDAGLLADLLEPTRLLRDILTIKGEENRASAVAELARILRGLTGWDDRPADDVLRDALSNLVNDQLALQRIYSSTTSQARLVGAINSLLTSTTEFEIAAEFFRPLHSLFAPTNRSGNRRTSIFTVFEEALSTSGPRPLVIIDFSGGAGGGLLETTSVKARILREVCSILNLRAEQLFQKGGRMNALVVFDEAQRFAAEAAEEDETKLLADRLVDYVRTTRKYGLGWMFITQEISSLRRAIYAQLRVRAFGYGLTAGTELQRLRETISDPAALDLYRSFVDPAAIRPSEYPFMLTGPVSPLSFTGAPVFLSVYTSFDEAKLANGW